MHNKSLPTCPFLSPPVSFVLPFCRCPIYACDIVSVLYLRNASGAVATWSTRLTSRLNWIASLANMGILLFVIIAGFTQADPSNMTPFLPFGVKGVFKTASILFFAYLGFDLFATMAEETKNPGKDIPLGLVGSMIWATEFYCLMALTLSLMQTYKEIDPNAVFPLAFAHHAGWNWAHFVVALGALKGMTTILLGNAVGQARYVTQSLLGSLMSMPPQAPPSVPLL
ncbi:hypothetical protein L7F22_009897 [Adiantum nelumboides]|nr:hypothetical protein [Adiantum nelumboides]